MTKKIGFIGQGWIGKNYADDMEKRGYQTIRYSLNEAHVKNKDEIKNCDIVFIAVPTPTTTNGFSDKIVREAIKLVGQGKTAVIKSTILPGTTESIQKESPDIFVLHSPEFLVAKTAEYDAAHPKRNIIGIPIDSPEYREKAEEVMAILPRALFEKICPVKEAELVKYGSNCFLYLKVVYANILYDLAEKLGCDWELVRDAIGADPRINQSHMEPIHADGRGAGGMCLVKDYEALLRFYLEKIGNDRGAQALLAIREKNLELLLNSKKSLDLIKEVYGEEMINGEKNKNI
jgi:UDPglucose 6-dehydrogenase